MKRGVHWNMTGVPKGYAICGIPVVHDPKNRFIADARGFWPRKRIAVGPSWFRLPFAVQQAILLHEAGHCLGFHLEIRLLIGLFCATRWARCLAHRHEFEADRFAVERGAGAGLKILLTMAKIIPEHYFEPPRAERISAIERLMKGASDAA
jgi:hypothetical protein